MRNGPGRVAATVSQLTGGLGFTLMFGFAAHIAVALIGMMAIPYYLEYMGADAYGLVGFYLVLQGWMLLLDLGIAPAVGRQLSRHKAGALAADDAVSLLGAAEAFFLVIGLAAGGGWFLSTGWVASHWLGASKLHAHEERLCLQVAAVLLILRWVAGMYQTALVGLERQVAVNVVAFVGALLRNVGSIVGLILISRSPLVFFVVWTVVTFGEAVANRALLARAMPGGSLHWSRGWRLLTREFSFAAGLTVSSVIFTLIGQADKLTLSHILSLGDFGVFSLVVAICAGITLVVPPMVQAFQPRLTTLLTQGQRSAFVDTYRLSIDLIIVVSAGLAGTISARPDLVVYTWTGSHAIADRLVPTMTLFALGSGVNAFLYLPYVLQFAQGAIRLRVIGYVIFGAFWVPAAIWAAYRYGTVGAGWVWLGGNLLYLLLWVPVIHRSLLTRDELRGLAAESWTRVAVLAVILGCTRLIGADHLDRLTSLGLLVMISGLSTVAAALSSRRLRTYVASLIGRREPHLI